MTDISNHQHSHDALLLHFCEMTIEVPPTVDQYTFGRHGDLSIDDANPYLHRCLGAFKFDGSRWWLRNVGASTPVTMTLHDTNAQAVITAGASLPAGPGRFTVTFKSGPSNYELEGEVVAAPHDWADSVDLLVDGEETVEWGVVNLNPDQRLLLAALAEPALRGIHLHQFALPTNRQLALRLGWTLTKYNRKLDHLCVKFAKAGVSGMRGDLGDSASDRRHRLVSHCVAQGVVTVDDLELLPVASAH